MAIFDSENRPRGLRVPSLTAMKIGTSATKSQFSFHSKKSTNSQPDSSSTPSLTTIVPAPAPAPASQFKLKAMPPPNKDLPPTPKEELPQPVTAQAPPRSSSMVPPRREVLRKPPPSVTPPVTTAPKTGLRQASQQSPVTGIPAAPPQTPQSQSQSQPQPVHSQPAYRQTPAQAQAQSPITHSLPVYHSAQTRSTPPAPQPLPAQINQASRGPSAPASQPPTSQAPPSDLHIQHTFTSTDALTPLEDFIPTPEGGSTPLDPASSDEQASHTPSDDIEPIAAPLSKIHYACFQEHRNMPVAQNTWCPVPCMTCQKMDREIRHRCVFCCLRVCEGCYLALQRCRGRLLAELMSQLG